MKPNSLDFTINLSSIYKTKFLLFDICIRIRSEFRRLMYQHALLKQFERDQGFDLAQPSKFIIDYQEDGDFARNLWVNDYAPSMIDVINDILKPGKPKSSRRIISKIQQGRSLVLAILKQINKCPRKRILIITRKAGISDSRVDNQILPELIKEGKILKNDFGWYSLVEEN